MDWLETLLRVVNTFPVGCLVGLAFTIPFQLQCARAIKLCKEAHCGESDAVLRLRSLLHAYDKQRCSESTASAEARRFLDAYVQL